MSFLNRMFRKEVISDHSNKNDEAAKSTNTLDEYVADYVEGFIGGLFADGHVISFTEDDLQKWFSKPDDYYKEISNAMTYLYYTDGNVYQFYELMATLPSLNYSVKVFDNTKKGYEKNIALVNQTLHRTKYKQITRDVIKQLCVRGWVVCVWLGDKKSPHLHIFDNDYVFPAHRENGDFVAQIDMAWFDEMNETEREIYFNTLKSVVSESDYNKYKNNGEENKYMVLPVERTICLRANTLFRNQRIGLPYGTQYLFDHLHKQMLKNLEKTISNKIIKNIATLTLGNSDIKYNDLGRTIRNKVANGVHSVLKKKIASGSTPVVVLPDWAKLEWTNIDGLDDVLNKEKFENIDFDIAKDLSVPPSLLTGEGGNSATLKFAMSNLYRKIGVILEGCEEVFNKMLPLILSKSYAENLYIEFEKTQPLEAKDVLGTFMSLHAEGFAVKPIVDMMPNIDFGSYVDSSIYEQEILKLYDKIKPPATSYTQSPDADESGRPAVTETETDSEETIKTKDYDKNGE